MMASPKDSPAQHSALEKRCKELEAELAAAILKLDDAAKETNTLKDIAARAQADVQNSKMRLQRERDELGKFAVESLLRRLLPTVDSLVRAAQHIPAEHAGSEWAKGILAIEQQLLGELCDYGLKRMASLGAAFDPALHEVLMASPGDAGKILEVFEEGYLLHGKLLRPAKVKVGEKAE